MTTQEVMIAPLLHEVMNLDMKRTTSSRINPCVTACERNAANESSYHAVCAVHYTVLEETTGKYQYGLHLFFPGLPCLPPPALVVKCWTAG